VLASAGEETITMKNKTIKRAGAGLIIGGLFLLAVSAALLKYNLWADQQAKEASEAVKEQMEQQIVIHVESKPVTTDPEATPTLVEVPLYVTYPDMEMPTVEVDGHSYIGQLDIPALDLSLPIMEQWSYANLKIAPCRYTGSVYKNNLVIAAHNYTSHFGTLRNLTGGELVYFTDADGNVFTYRVAEVEQLMPTDIEKMTDSGWDLTLFTCTIGGSYRVTVRCEAVED
jgi:sortase A